MKRAVLGGLLAALIFSVAPTQAASPTLDALVANVPADAASVLAVRIADLQRSSLYTTLEQERLFRRHNSGLEEFSKATGIDPRRDIESIVCSTFGHGETESFACLVSGSFSSFRVAKAVEANAPNVKRLDTELLMLEMSDDEGEDSFRGSIALPVDGLAVFGESDGVKRVLSVWSGDAPSVGDSNLGELLSERRGQLFGAADFATLREQLGERMRGELPAAIQQIQHVSFDVDVMRDVSLLARIRAETEEDAELLRQSLLGFVATGKLSAKQDPELMALLAEIQIERSGRDVALSALVSEDILLSLRERAHAKVREHGHGHHHGERNRD